MIKFMCNSCGKDITDKVFDSVRQFCGRGYFAREVSEEGIQDRSGELPDGDEEGGSLRGTLHLEVQLLEELVKIIHASAWDMPSAVMHCSSCAMKRRDRKKEKVVTIFTKVKIVDRPYGGAGDSGHRVTKQAV